MKNWFWGIVIFIFGAYVAGSTSKPQPSTIPTPVYTSRDLVISSSKTSQIPNSNSSFSPLLTQSNQIYTNKNQVTGNYIPYKGNGGGPTVCADGKISNSKGKGTCSGHGGIAR